MSFLIDTDICSAYFKGDRRVSNKFLQYTGGISISAVTLGELFSGAMRIGQPSRRVDGILQMLQEVRVFAFDEIVAESFGKLRAQLLDSGSPVAMADLMIAATAVHHDFTLVTHNQRHFKVIPGLRVNDWLI